MEDLRSHYVRECSVYNCSLLHGYCVDDRDADCSMCCGSPDEQRHDRRYFEQYKKKGWNFTMKKQYDYLIVGSGLYGAIFAHEAKAHGKTVLVVDK